MSEVRHTELVDADATALLDAVRSGEGTVHSLVEFDDTGYNTLYVSSTTESLYESEAAMEAHFERIHNYVNIDFTEIQMFTRDLFPAADRVRYKTTALDIFTFVRVYAESRRGLFFALEPGDEVESHIEALEPLLTD